VPLVEQERPTLPEHLSADITKMITDCISVWKDSLKSDCQQSRQYQNRTNNHLSPQKIAHKKTQDMTMKVLVLDREKQLKRLYWPHIHMFLVEEDLVQSISHTATYF
jgi:hypothetical protein